MSARQSSTNVLLSITDNSMSRVHFTHFVWNCVQHLVSHPSQSQSGYFKQVLQNCEPTKVARIWTITALTISLLGGAIVWVPFLKSNVRWIYAAYSWLISTVLQILSDLIFVSVFYRLRRVDLPVLVNSERFPKFDLGPHFIVSMSSICSLFSKFCAPFNERLSWRGIYVMYFSLRYICCNFGRVRYSAAVLTETSVSEKNCKAQENKRAARRGWAKNSRKKTKRNEKQNERNCKAESCVDQANFGFAKEKFNVRLVQGQVQKI